MASFDSIFVIENERANLDGGEFLVKIKSRTTPNTLTWKGFKRTEALDFRYRDVSFSFL